MLAIAVVLFHSGTTLFSMKLIDGFSAVMLFFIISGFYMALILNGKYNSYGAFLTNRFLKLYPVYWVVLALAWMSPSTPFAGLSGSALAYWLFANIFVVGSHLTSVIINTPEGFGLLPFGRQIAAPEMTWGRLYIGPVWSISVEILFYLVAPLLVAAKGRFAKMAFMFAVSAVAYIYLRVHESAFIPWTYNFLLPTLYLFALGAVAWNIYDSERFKQFYTVRKAALAYTLMLAYVLLHVEYMTYVGLPLFGSGEIANLVGALVFMLCLPFAFELTAKSSIDRHIGDLSYPIYLSHTLVLQHAPWAAGLNPLVTTIGMSVLLSYGVMKPIDRYRAARVK